jgi:hypothetical protein
MELYLLFKNALKNEKFIFCFLCFFVMGQILFTYKGVETFPFWNYGMYSAPAAKPEFLEKKTLLVNNKKIDLSKLAVSETFLKYQLDYHIHYYAKDKKLGLWLKSKLEKVISEKIYSIRLLLQQYHSLENPVLLKEEIHELYPFR